MTDRTRNRRTSSRTLKSMILELVTFQLKSEIRTLNQCYIMFINTIIQFPNKVHTSVFRIFKNNIQQLMLK